MRAGVVFFLIAGVAMAALGVLAVRADQFAANPPTVLQSALSYWMSFVLAALFISIALLGWFGLLLRRPRRYRNPYRHR